MSTLAVKFYPKAHDVKFTDVFLIVELIDGRTLSIPLIWFPRLSKATQEQLKNWELMGEGEGIHWPDLDEDLSIAGLLAGNYQS